MSTEQLPDGLQLAVNIIREAEWPEGAGGNPLEVERNDLRARLDACKADAAAAWVRYENANRLQVSLQMERAEMRAKYDELLVALHGIGRALGIPEGARSPYSITCGVLERVNRLAAIEAQEPVAISKAGNLFWAGNPQDWRGVDCSLFARPVPAQAVPDVPNAACDVLAERRRQVEKEGYEPAHDDEHADGSLAMAAACYADKERPQSMCPGRWPWSADSWKPKDRRTDLVRAAALILAEIERMDRAAIAKATGAAQAVPDADGARFRWLCEDHSDRETRERCRSLIDRLPVMSYSDAVMSIDAAMAGRSTGAQGMRSRTGAMLAAVPAQAVPMSDERIDAIAELVIKGMPDGICGFMRTWGYQQFARALLEVCAGHYRAQAVPDVIKPGEEK